MNEIKKLLFIVNKFSGTGYPHGFERLILKACEKNTIHGVIKFTAGRGHAEELARNGVGKYDGIIAVGGDGTINETAKGLVSTSTPLGILPKGSGNGLAQHIRIPLPFSSAFDTLVNGKIIAMDTFRINGNLSVNVSGIGFDGHIANLFATHQTRGLWGYVRLIFNEYLYYKEFQWTLKTGSQIFHYKSFIIAIANSSQYGNNAFIAPYASITDGVLNISVINKLPLYQLPAFAYRIFNKKLKETQQFKMLMMDTMVIQIPAPVSYHIDGEPAGISDLFTIETKPGSLNVIVPKTSQP